MRMPVGKTNYLSPNYSCAFFAPTSRSIARAVALGRRVSKSSHPTQSG